MGNIYDDNQKSFHGPSGQKQAHQGPYGGKNADNLSNNNVSQVLQPTKDIKARPKHQ